MGSAYHPLLTACHQVVREETGGVLPIYWLGCSMGGAVACRASQIKPDCGVSGMVSHQSSAISHQSSGISHQLSAISHQPSAISHQPCTCQNPTTAEYMQIC